MRKIAVLLLICMLLAGLSACGGNSSGPAADGPTPTPTREQRLEASETDAAQAAMSHLPPATSSDLEPDYDASAYETAQNYVGQPAAALIKAIGEPASSEYSASCEQAGAEDGMLAYRGFSVWTMRTQTGEIVRGVYLDDEE